MPVHRHDTVSHLQSDVKKSFLSPSTAAAPNARPLKRPFDAEREGTQATSNMTSEPSYLESKSRIRVTDLQEAKRLKQKWAMLTSYDTMSAQIFDRARIPCLLVGDSAGQMVFGYDSTLPVTVDELLPLARAVSTACKRALVIADLPFGSYQASVESAVQNSIRFMKEGRVHAVKLQGGEDYAPHVKAIVKAGVPVMAHIGFQPQNLHSHGGLKVQARDKESINKLVTDALTLQQAGAFACVLELVSSSAGKTVMEYLDIPTIGMGAGPDCDAQVLVWHDMAGFNALRNNHTSPEGQDDLQIAKAPKFVKRFANLSMELYEAAREYALEVELGSFPSEGNCFSMSSHPAPSEPPRRVLSTTLTGPAAAFYGKHLNNKRRFC